MPAKSRRAPAPRAQHQVRGGGRTGRAGGAAWGPPTADSRPRGTLSQVERDAECPLRVPRTCGSGVLPERAARAGGLGPALRRGSPAFPGPGRRPSALRWSPEMVVPRAGWGGAARRSQLPLPPHLSAFGLPRPAPRREGWGENTRPRAGCACSRGVPGPRLPGRFRGFGVLSGGPCGRCPPCTPQGTQRSGVGTAKIRGLADGGHVLSS